MQYKWTFGAATFKRRLILLMAEKGLSQNAVAEFAGVSQGTVSRWLSGSTPELENVTSLASKTEVPLSWLAYGEGHLKIDYKGVDGFIHRAKSRVIPRLSDVCQKLSALQDSDFFTPEEAGIIEDMRQALTSRRARLSACVEALENLPAEEEVAVCEILSKHYIQKQTDFVRGDLCVALGLRGMATDDEILEACRLVFNKYPAPRVPARKKSFAPTKRPAK